MRTVIARLSVDEDRLFDMGYKETIDGVEMEFGWLAHSGINLSDAFIADDDEDDIWYAYVNYVANWAFNPDEGSSPVSFSEWVEKRWNSGR